MSYFEVDTLKTTDAQCGILEEDVNDAIHVSEHPPEWRRTYWSYRAMQAGPILTNGAPAGGVRVADAGEIGDSLFH